MKRSLKRKQLKTARNKPNDVKKLIQTELPFVAAGKFKGATEATRELPKCGNDLCNDTENPLQHHKQDQVDDSSADELWPEDLHLVLSESETETPSGNDLKVITDEPIIHQNQVQVDDSSADELWLDDLQLVLSDSDSETDRPSGNDLKVITDEPIIHQKQDQVDVTKVITQNPDKQKAIGIDDNFAAGNTNKIMKSLFENKSFKFPKFSVLNKKIQKNSEGVKTRCLHIKFFYFYDDPHQSYYGTWSKRSNIIRPRQPFAKDLKVFDYNNEFGAEWKERALRQKEEEKQYEDDAITIEAQKEKLKILKQKIADNPETGTKEMEGCVFECFWADKNGNKPNGYPQGTWDELNKNSKLYKK